MSKIIGRKQEIETLKHVCAAKEAQFIAIYGRRRIGKTHLIREFFRPRADVYFSITGLKDGSLSEQLKLLQEEIEKVFFKQTRIPEITSWREGLKLLASLLKEHHPESKGKQLVIFLDELPWLATPRSGLVQALDHVWNTELSQIPGTRLIVCGSAASWIIDHLINAKGGLHNRITRKIPLFPFDLSETFEYLQSLGMHLNRIQTLEIYMAIGGVAHYLSQIEKGLSARQNISKLCFSPPGLLRDEFNNLFRSLFDNSENHSKIIQALATRNEGLTRNEIILLTKIPSGGRLAKWLTELEQAGFIDAFVPFGKTEKYSTYRIVDEYVWFYFKWIKKAPKHLDAENYWEKMTSSNAYQSWAGFAFEAICLKHLRQIKEELNIQNLVTRSSPWRYIPAKNDLQDQGAQIDLVMDRTDDAITLVEIKYSSGIFVVEKYYSRELKKKAEVFEAKTGTRKQLFMVLVTTHGLKANTWSEGLITKVVTLDALFR